MTLRVSIAARLRLALVGATVLPCTVHAQDASLPQLPPINPPVLIGDADQGLEMDVRRRHRPEFDPIGFDIGGWRLYPSVAGGVGYESNIFGESGNADSAPYLQVQPAIALEKTPSWGAIRFDASGRFARFIGQEHANEDSFRVEASGSRTLGADTVGELGAEVAQLIERRDSSGFPDGRVEPVRYLQTQFYARAAHETGRLRLLGGVDYTIFDFRDTRALSSDNDVLGTIDQDARDQSTIRGTARAEYGVSANIGVFVQGSGQSTDYRREEIAPGVRNLGGPSYTALAGVTVDIARLVRGSVGVGYVWRSYDGSIPDVNGLAINADVAYYLTPILTLSATASRTVEEAVLQDASTYTSTAAGVRADYELRRWLVISAGVDYRYNDFRNNPRNDKIWNAFASAAYNVDRHITFRLDASYVDRSVENDPFAASYGDYSILAGIAYNL